MPINDTGNISLAEINEMNIPMNCWVHPPDEESPKWRWTAGCYQPRRDHFIDSSAGFSFEADTKEELIEAVNQNVVPVYEVALHNLKTTGHNYYWEMNDEEGLSRKEWDAYKDRNLAAPGDI